MSVDIWVCPMMSKVPHFFASVFRRLSALSASPKVLLDRLLALSTWRKVLLAYPICVMWGGIWQNPFFAVLVGSLYWVGFAGFVLFLTAPRHQDKQWTYVALGATGVLVMILWLEILRWTFPFYV
jgi:hypothetical protein